jgi:hypothetical protein
VAKLLESETAYYTGGHYRSLARNELCCLYPYFADELGRECYRSMLISMYDITMGYIHAEHLYGLAIRDYVEIGVRRSQTSS